MNNNQIKESMKFILEIRQVLEKYNDKKESLINQTEGVSPELKMVNEIREDLKGFLNSDFVKVTEEKFSEIEA
ncbi:MULTISPECIES: hypothetical protein [unclassified Clostridium]|uniref:hypothetical protein n=1 Tax=unclassified Clostridium TaxID=2614128 RepID=UPI0025BBD0E0|nr:MULTISPECIES: hypothetical protein [unclassified Clostridium]